MQFCIIIILIYILRDTWKKGNTNCLNLILEIISVFLVNLQLALRILLVENLFAS